MPAALVLILCNILWSANPLMGKLALESFSSLQVAWLRVGISLLCFAGVGLARYRIDDLLHVPRTWRHGSVQFLLGFLSFAFTPFLIYAGLEKTQSIDNAVIVAMEPLLTILMAAVFLGERMNWRMRVSLLVALTGFAMLNNFSLGLHSLANTLILASLFGEAGYSVMSKFLLDVAPPRKIVFSALVVGFVVLTICLGVRGDLQTWQTVSFRSALGILYLGAIGTALTYFLWTHTLSRGFAVMLLAFSLYLQPALGIFWGSIFLHETFGTIEIAGTLLILVSVAICLGRMKGSAAEN